MVSRGYGIWNDWIRFQHPLRAPVAANVANDVQSVEVCLIDGLFLTMISSRETQQACQDSRISIDVRLGSDID